MPSPSRSTLLVLACNPHNTRVQQVAVRRPGSHVELEFELVGDFPIIRRFPMEPAQTQ